MSKVFKAYRLLSGRFLPRERPFDQPEKSHGILILPEPLPREPVEAAWSYAIRYTAKGVDMPDFEAAIALMLERHPTWRVEQEIPIGRVAYNPDRAEDDKPDV